MNLNEFNTKIRKLRVKHSDELRNVRVDICINGHEYIPVTDFGESLGRMLLVSSPTYKSMDYIDLLRKLNLLILRKSNLNKEVVLMYAGGVEYIPDSIYLNKKGIIINMI